MDFSGFKFKKTKKPSLKYIKCNNYSWSKLVWPSIQEGSLVLDYYRYSWVSKHLIRLYTIKVNSNATWELDGVKQTCKPTTGQLKARIIHKNEVGYFLTGGCSILDSEIIDNFMDTHKISYRGYDSCFRLQKFLTRKINTAKVPKEYYFKADDYSNKVFEQDGNTYIKNGHRICCITKDNVVYNYMSYNGDIVPPTELCIVANDSRKLNADIYKYVKIHNKNVNEVLFCFKHQLFNVMHFIDRVKGLHLNKLKVLNEYGTYEIRYFLDEFDTKFLQSIDLNTFKVLLQLKHYYFPNIKEKYKYYIKYLNVFSNNPSLKFHYATETAYLRECSDYFRMYNYFPNNLPKYPNPLDIYVKHNEITREYNKFRRLEESQRNLEYNKVYLNIKKELDKLNYSFKDFTIFSPNAISDLSVEGETLHHCVGSYISSVVNKHTRIYFLRKISDIDTPYFTVEVNYNNTIKQCHTYCNRTINTVSEYDSLLEFLQSWCSAKGLRMENKNGIM